MITESGLFREEKMQQQAAKKTNRKIVAKYNQKAKITSQNSQKKRNSQILQRFGKSILSEITQYC